MCVDDARDLGVELRWRDDAIDETPAARVCASMNSPVNSISNARFSTRCATRDARRRAEQPVVDAGRRETRLAGATARSQAATTWQPAAVAMPCTRAITGCGSDCIVSITRLQRSNRAADERLGPVRHHFLQVVPAGECAPRSRDDDGADRRIGGNRVELGLHASSIATEIALNWRGDSS
jgi:hypothetical protein